MKLHLNAGVYFQHKKKKEQNIGTTARSTHEHQNRPKAQRVLSAPKISLSLSLLFSLLGLDRSETYRFDSIQLFSPSTFSCFHSHFDDCELRQHRQAAKRHIYANRIHALSRIQFKNFVYILMSGINYCRIAEHGIIWHTEPAAVNTSSLIHRMHAPASGCVARSAYTAQIACYSYKR